MNPPPLPPRPNPVARFFVGLWDVMNFTRRLILNLLFFGLLFLILIGLMVAVGKGFEQTDGFLRRWPSATLALLALAALFARLMLTQDPT